MDSTPEDRAQTERRARMSKTRSPAQQQRRAARETAFNAGFDAAQFACAERMGFSLDVNVRRYLDQRSRAYSDWEYAEDRDAAR